LYTLMYDPTTLLSMETTNALKSLPPQELVLNKTSEDLLLTAAKWSKVLAVFALLLCAGRIAVMLYKDVPTSKPIEEISGTLSNLAISLVPLFVALYLFRFAQNAAKAIEAKDQLLLTKAFSSLKSLFKLAGILAVVMVVSYTISLFVLEDSILK
jgi:hypothetical protein